MVTTDNSDIIRGDREMGMRLAEERRRLSLKADDLAEIGGVKRNAQSEYENGKRFFQVDYLRRIGAAGIDAGYVMTGERSPPTRSEAPHLVTMQVAFPARAALAEMFESVLQVYPDLHGAELAQVLARHLPSALAQLSDLRLAAAGLNVPKPAAPLDRSEDHRESRSASSR